MVWFAITLGLFSLAVAIARWWTHRQFVAEQATLRRYSQWTCPACGDAYGDAVRYTRYAQVHAVTLQGQEFVRHVVLVCPHCRYLTCFDPQGHHHPALSAPFNTDI